eukprot:1808147-Alexandrium_andersonii.AAC.1
MRDSCRCGVAWSRLCYLTAGNRRDARRATSGEGKAWVVALASNALGRVRDLAEDGVIEAQPGPAGR